MKSVRFKGIIFDLDGTLIDSVPDVRSALNRVLVDNGQNVLTIDEVKRLVGHGPRYLLSGAFSISGRTLSESNISELIEQYVFYYRENPVERTVVYPGVMTVLENLYAENKILAICSNKPDEMVKIVLDKLKLNLFFKVVVSGDKVLHPKPDKRHILCVLEKMGVLATDSIVVGDSESDVLAAQAAGMPVIAVTYGYSACVPEMLGANLLINDFLELPDALRKIV